MKRSTLPARLVQSLVQSLGPLLVPLLVAGSLPLRAEDLRVIVWDSRQPEQKQVYPEFLGGAIARHLESVDGLRVRSVSIDDAEQGLSESLLDECDVLVQWVHGRKGELSPETGRRVLARILDGRLMYLPLHSAHWASPFVEAMNWRARADARREHGGVAGEVVEIAAVPPPRRFTTPKKDSPMTPRSTSRKLPGGKTRVELHLPNCCFPGYRPDGKPSSVRGLLPGHPIAAGLPPSFEIPATEMYDEPFHVPEPDQVVFDERWPTGEWFRSASVWDIGAGKIFYFRPGHETYGVFLQKEPLRIIENAVTWLGHVKRGVERSQVVAARILDAGGFTDGLTHLTDIIPSTGTAWTRANRVYLDLGEKGASSVSFPRLNNSILAVSLLGRKPKEGGKSPRVRQDPRTWTIDCGDSVASDESPIVVLELDGPVHVPLEPRAVAQRSDGGFTLAARDVVVSGENKLQYEPLPHKNTLGYWVDEKEHAWWVVDVERPGRYDVHVFQGCGKGQGGSEVEISLGDSRTTFLVEDTGHFQNFKWRRVGQVEAPSPGRYRVGVRALKKAKAAVMDLRTLELRPVN